MNRGKTVWWQGEDGHLQDKAGGLRLRKPCQHFDPGLLVSGTVRNQENFQKLSMMIKHKRKKERKKSFYFLILNEIFWPSC